MRITSILSGILVILALQITWCVPRYARAANDICRAKITNMPSKVEVIPIHIFFYKQLDFQFQHGVANDFCQNEAENCLTVA